MPDLSGQDGLAFRTCNAGRCGGSQVKAPAGEAHDFDGACLIPLCFLLAGITCVDFARLSRESLESGKTPSQTYASPSHTAHNNQDSSRSSTAVGTRLWGSCAAEAMELRSPLTAAPSRGGGGEQF